MAAPFFVTQSAILPGRWILYRRVPTLRHCGYFETPSDAIDYAHRNWPWWP